MKRRVVKYTSVCFPLLMVFGLMMCPGCASIICGDSKTITISSIPDGANYSIMGKDGKEIHRGTTPDTLTLKRGRGFFKAGDYSIKISKPGCKEYNMEMKQDLNPWYLFGNIHIGGLIGWVIVDPITGAMWDPHDVNAALDCETSFLDPNLRYPKILNLNELHKTMNTQVVRIN